MQNKFDSKGSFLKQEDEEKQENLSGKASMWDIKGEEKQWHQVIERTKNKILFKL